jgi:hypothetical protein
MKRLQQCTAATAGQREEVLEQDTNHSIQDLDAVAVEAVVKANTL